RVRTRVLPEPAPARMHRGADSVTTASRWAALRPARSSSAEAEGTMRSTVPTGCDRNADGRRPRRRQRRRRPYAAHDDSVAPNDSCAEGVVIRPQTARITKVSAHESFGALT